MPLLKYLKLKSVALEICSSIFVKILSVKILIIPSLDVVNINCIWNILSNPSSSSEYIEPERNSESIKGQNSVTNSQK